MLPPLRAGGTIEQRSRRGAGRERSHGANARVSSPEVGAESRTPICRSGGKMISRLPEDQRYWNALTDRVVASTHGSGTRRWWHGLSRFAVPLRIAAAAALLAALVWQ